MASVIQASDLEFSKALRDNHILQLDGRRPVSFAQLTNHSAGFLRPITSTQLSNILVFILTALISYALSRQDTPTSRLLDILETDHEVPKPVTKQILQWFGVLDGETWNMNEIDLVKHVGLGILQPHAVSLTLNTCSSLGH